MGSKLTHQTSPLFTCYVLKGHLCPIQGFRFSLFVFLHLGVCQFQVWANYMRANQFLNKFADFAWTDGLMKTFINFLIYGYGQLFLHISPPLYAYGIRIINRYVNNSATYRWFRLKA